MRWLAVTAIGFTTLTTLSAHAHLELQSPAPRHDGTEQKSGPCGRAGGVRGTEVTVFRPGERIEVVWQETVNHPAHYRIAFDIDGDDSFVDPPCETHCDDRMDPEYPTFTMYADPTVLLDDIEDGNRSAGRAQITLPDVECENCTLQVIQVMYDKRPITVGGNDIYYTCADIALRRDALPSDGGSTTGDAGTIGDGGSRDGDVLGIGDDASGADAGNDPGTPAGSVDGSCGVSRRPGPAAVVLAIALLWTRRRRSQR